MAVSSIFNDVIGPVMRGPSSSHSAAGCRIGLLLRDLIDGNIARDLLCANNSFANNYLLPTVKLVL